MPKYKCKLHPRFGEEAFHNQRIAASCQVNAYAKLCERMGIEMVEVPEVDFRAAFMRRIHETSNLNSIPEGIGASPPSPVTNDTCVSYRGIRMWFRPDGRPNEE